MALWSVDGKTNSFDKIAEPITPGTTSVSNIVDGKPPTGKLIAKDAAIIVNDGTNNRIIIGFLANGF
jgi:hypothetical protein